MLFLALVALMLLAGARRWTPLAPLYTAATAALLLALQFGSSASWRAEAGLAGPSALDLVPALLLATAAPFAAYWAARGVANAWRRPG